VNDQTSAIERTQAGAQCRALGVLHETLKDRQRRVVFVEQHANAPEHSHCL